MSFEGVSFAAMLALLAVAAAVLLIGLRARRHASALAVGEGRFADARAHADVSEAAERDSLYAAAIAAKHLLDWEESERLLRRILADDDDGEAWLELGLVETYRGSLDSALESFDRAAALRADLLESITLHRAFVHLRLGDVERACRLFEEIEAALETKLRTDIGSGEPFFLEWFLQAAALWGASGRVSNADWATAAAQDAIGDSRLPELYRNDLNE